MLSSMEIKLLIRKDYACVSIRDGSSRYQTAQNTDIFFTEESITQIDITPYKTSYVIDIEPYEIQNT